MDDEVDYNDVEDDINDDEQLNHPLRNNSDDSNNEPIMGTTTSTLRHASSEVKLTSMSIDPNNRNNV